MQGDFGDEEIAPAAKGIGFGSPPVRWGYPRRNVRVSMVHWRQCPTKSDTMLATPRDQRDKLYTLA
jgi:hypothetical protein